MILRHTLMNPFLLDEHGGICRINRVAEAILAERDSLQLHNGLLEDLRLTAGAADEVGLAYDTALALVKQRYRQQHAALTAHPAPVTQPAAPWKVTVGIMKQPRF